MRYARLGRSGLVISRIGLGMMSYGDPAAASWYLDEERAEPIVRRAVEAGVTFFDTADMYSTGTSEEITGRLLRRLFANRDDYVLATKVYYPMGPGPNDRGLSRKHLTAALEASLRRLGTDHVDLYQLHRWDPGTPIEETMTALADAVGAGKVRYVGASLMYAWQCVKAQYAAATGFASMQTRYNLVYREEEREVIPFCLDAGIGVLPYSPLAQGLLAGTHRRTARVAATGVTRASAGSSDAIVAAVREAAAEQGVPPARVALAWLLGRPGVVAPIIGATKVEHLTDALAAVELPLDEATAARLSAPYKPRSPYGYS
jgi:1-deoxyxylulose-5-phosphate synthase